jgi:hypothetical protein
MRRLPRTHLIALLVAVPALAAAGCGGSQVSADEVPGSPPALTVPTDSDLGAAGSNADSTSGSADESADSADSGASADTGADDTGTTAPADVGTTAPAPEATTAPEETGGAAPPPAGSPPEQFEDFCEQNAGAC